MDEKCEGAIAQVENRGKNKWMKKGRKEGMKKGKKDLINEMLEYYSLEEVAHILKKDVVELDNFLKN